VTRRGQARFSGRRLFTEPTRVRAGKKWKAQSPLRRRQEPEGGKHAIAAYYSRMAKKPSASSPRERKELAALAKLPDSAIDTSDIPAATDWSKARIGRFYRSPKRSKSEL